MAEFENEFTKAIKEIETMMADIPTEEQLEILTKYQNKLILESLSRNVK